MMRFLVKDIAALGAMGLFAATVIVWASALPAMM
jgi:hypothetical protein